MNEMSTQSTATAPKRRSRSTWCVRLAVYFASTAMMGQPASSDGVAVEYASDIQPIFLAKCIKCHGPAEQNGGLRLDSSQAALEGGDRGPTIAAADVSQSILLQAVMRTGVVPPMPPEDEGSIVTDREVDVLRAWLTARLRTLDHEFTGPRKTTKTLSSHWAFQPIQRPPVPTLDASKAIVANEVDAFVLKRLQELSVAP